MAAVHFQSGPPAFQKLLMQQQTTALRRQSVLISFHLHTGVCGSRHILYLRTALGMEVHQGYTANFPEYESSC